MDKKLTDVTELLNLILATQVSILAQLKQNANPSDQSKHPLTAGYFRDAGRDVSQNTNLIFESLLKTRES